MGKKNFKINLITAQADFIYSHVFTQYYGMECYVQVKYFVSLVCFQVTQNNLLPHLPQMSHQFHTQYIIYRPPSNNTCVLDLEGNVNVNLHDHSQVCNDERVKELFPLYTYNLPLNGRHMIYTTKNYLHHLQQ
jgi:hypothetical protein